MCRITGVYIQWKMTLISINHFKVEHNYLRQISVFVVITVDAKFLIEFLRLNLELTQYRYNSAKIALFHKMSMCHIHMRRLKRQNCVGL